MKYFYFLLAVIFTSQSFYSQNINFQDSNFKNALIVLGIDTSGDNEIQITEAEAVTTLNISSNNIATLMGIEFSEYELNNSIANITGVEYFVNLETLDISSNVIGNLDISALTKLKTLLCERNPIETLDLSLLPDLEILNCYQNTLTSLTLNSTNSLLFLNLGSNRNLGLNSFLQSNLSNLTNLTTLKCASNNLTSFNFNALTNLEELDLYNNSLNTLNIGALTKLKKLSCSYNQLTSLDVSNSVDLENLTCNNNSLNTLNINGLTKITRLICNNNQLSTLSVASLSNLDFLNCDNNQLTILNVENLSNLKTLYCRNNQISSLSAENLNTIQSLKCSFNKLTTLDISNLEKIQFLDCNDNELTSLLVDGSSIALIRCHNNKLTSLDFSNANKLDHLECNNNELTTLSIKNGTNETTYNDTEVTIDFENNPNLEYICCDSFEASTVQGLVDSYGYTNCEVSISCGVSTDAINFPDPNFKNALLNHTPIIDVNNDGEIQVFEAKDLTTLGIAEQNISSIEGIEYFFNLTRLTFYDNLIETADISALVNLEILELRSNKLTSLDLRGLNKLEYAYIQRNELTSLNIDGLTNLIQLDCSYNQLTSLDVSSLINMTNLNCGINNLTSLTLGTLNSLETLLCHHNELTELETANLPNLTRLACNTNQLTSIDLSNLSYLENFNCQENPITELDFSTLFNLKYLGCGYSNLANLDVSNSPKLETLNCGNTPNLTKLTLKNNSLETNLYLVNIPNLSYICSDENEIISLQSLVDSYGYNCTVDSNCITDNDIIVSIPDTNLKNYLINSNCVDTDNDAIGDTSVDINNDGEIQLNEAKAVKVLLFPQSFQEAFIVLDISGLESFTNLKQVDFGWVNFYDASNLETAPINFDFTALTKLESLKLNHAESFKLESINFSGLASLKILELVNIRPFNFSTNPVNFVNVNLEGCLNLEKLNYNNSFLNIDFCQVPNVVNLNCSYLEGGEPEIFDFSCLTNLENLDVSENLIDKLILKNGSVLKNITFNYIGDEPGAYFPFPNFICLDELQEEHDMISGLIGANTTVNSFCSFTPGGDYYSLEGQINIDIENNNCSTTNNIPFPYLKFNLDNGTNSNVFISDATKNYNFSLQKGDYTITPILENSSYYNASPSSISISFPNDGDTINQDFCLIPNGTHNDLEISIIPTSIARPGFNSVYKIVYKNKGNQPLSGSVEVNFQDDLMDLITASPEVNTQSASLLTWDYNNLKPFESKDILVTFNINTPLETPAVNDGDILNLTANIYPITGDDTKADNTFTLNQSVVNSFDPNDKTCLEGNIITPDLIGEYVHYLIRCENTGSAEAVNIVIKDVIDETRFDINSLVVTSSSHAMVTEIDGNNVEFIFENINLPFDDANNDGYVAFKIKTLPSLQIGDTLENEAEIYFDYNKPIITNKAQTSINNVLSTNTSEQSNNISLFPNPTQDKLFINSKNTIEFIEFYDITGRLVKSISFTENRISTKLSTKTLLAGSYFVKVKTNLGEHVAKIIKR